MWSRYGLTLASSELVGPSSWHLIVYTSSNQGFREAESLGLGLGAFRRVFLSLCLISSVEGEGAHPLRILSPLLPSWMALQPALLRALLGETWRAWGVGFQR